MGTFYFKFFKDSTVTGTIFFVHPHKQNKSYKLSNSFLFRLYFAKRQLYFV